MISMPSAFSRGQQRPHGIGVADLEAEVQELRQPGGVADSVQGEIEAVGVANDHRAVVVLLGGGRVEAEVRLVELAAARDVTHRQAEVQQIHGRKSGTAGRSTRRVPYRLSRW
jgi:hypothetical protein